MQYFNNEKVYIVVMNIYSLCVMNNNSYAENNKTEWREKKMPRQDRTGPMGQGPLTGMGFGPCGNGCGTQRGFGRGFGFGRGRGMGFGRGFCYAAPSALTEAEEKKILEAELNEIEAEKQEIAKRLKELK